MPSRPVADLVYFRDFDTHTESAVRWEAETGSFMLLAISHKLEAKATKRFKESATTVAERRTYTVPLMEAFHCAAKVIPGISITPGVMGGAPCITDTRIPAYMVLDEMEYYGTIEGVQGSYPRLTVEQIKAALQFAKTVVECPLDSDETCATSR